MAEGTDSYKGLAVPLFGDFEIKQRIAATDIMTITGASAQTGDFIVATAVGTEMFVVEDSGRIVAADWPTFSITALTTLPTAGLEVSQLFWADTDNLRTFGIGLSATSIYKIALTDN